MIQIDLKLFVTLAKYLPLGSEAYEINEGTTINELMTDLGIPHDIVKLIFINGKKQDRNYHYKPKSLFIPCISFKEISINRSKGIPRFSHSLMISLFVFLANAFF